MPDLNVVPGVVTASGMRQGTVTSSNGHGQRGALRHADVAKPAPTPTEGGSPSCSASQCSVRGVTQTPSGAEKTQVVATVLQTAVHAESGQARSIGEWAALGCLLGSTGFDTESESEAIVQAGPARLNQPANVSCERQRGFLSGCGLSGVHARGARVARGRKHTRSAASLLLVAAKIQQVVEAPAPWRQGPSRASISNTHASELLMSNSWTAVQLRATPLLEKQPIICAQRQGSASWLASVDDCATGSAAAQPANVLAHGRGGYRPADHGKVKSRSNRAEDAMITQVRAPG